MPFQKAVKFAAKGRIALAGPAGAGKTYTALKFATTLAEGGTIAVIDTERGSASKYADQFDFDVMELETFHPDRFVEGIREAERGGYAVLVIDSLSHAWNGPGGVLELVEAASKRKGNSFTAWAEVTPLHNRMIEAITKASIHVIITLRSKQEYSLEKDEKTGKSVPRKVGMAPIQRDGVEYEVDVYGDMDVENTLIVQKSRCPALSGKVFQKPDERVATIFKEWLSGAPAPEKAPDYRQLYDAGKARGLWTNGTGFYAFATSKLPGVTVAPETVKELSEMQRLQLAYAIDEAEPVEASSGK